MRTAARAHRLISQGKITAFGKVRYTLDGSDPRYSDSAKDYVPALC